jgi:small subunit ribosomal protein S16
LLPGTSPHEVIMVVIRLARGGAKKRPFFSLIATDRQNRRDGRFIERVGYYNPIAAEGEAGLKISLDRVEYWRSQGAQVSPAAERLVRRFAASIQAAPAA